MGQSWIGRFKEQSFTKKWFEILFVGMLIAWLLPSVLPLPIAGLIGGLFFLTGYYRGIFYCAIQNRAKPYFIEIKNNPSNCLGMVFISIVSIAIIFWMLSRDHTIYCFDYLQFWEPAVYSSQNIFIHPVEVIKNVFSSINGKDYNHFLPILLMFPMKILGMDLITYAICGWIMFFLPAAILLCIGFQMYMDKVGFKRIPYVLSFSIILLLPILYIPVWKGYMNISILLPGAICWLIFLQLQWERVDKARLFQFSIMSILVVIQCRSGAYMIIGLMIGILMHFLLQLRCVEKKQRCCVVKNFVKSYMFIGLYVLGILLLFFRGFLKRSVMYDFQVAYSAYAVGKGVIDRVCGELTYFGVVLWGLVFLGIIFGMKKHGTRSYTVLWVFWIVSVLYGISTVQIAGMHHLYVISIPFVFLILQLLGYIYNFVLCKKFYIACILLAVLFNYVNVVCAWHVPYCGAEYNPSIRYDVEVVHRMVQDLQAETAAGRDKIYLVSSSVLLNQDILKKERMPQEIDSLPGLSDPAQIDLRDGFHTNFFDASIVIITDPIQTHLLPKDQQVITILAAAMVQNTCVSRKMKEIDSYELNPIQKDDHSDRIKVKVYRRMHPVTLDEVNYLEDLFDAAYPTHPELFKNRFEKYKHEHFE